MTYFIIDPFQYNGQMAFRQEQRASSSSKILDSGIRILLFYLVLET